MRHSADIGRLIHQVDQMSKGRIDLNARIQGLEKALGEASATIRRDHAYTASVAGSPCVCKWCLDTPEEPNRELEEALREAEDRAARP